MRRAPRHDAPRPLGEQRLAVLRAVALEPLTATEVAARLGCAKLAARSHLIALADRGLVVLRGGRYHAGPR